MKKRKYPRGWGLFGVVLFVGWLWWTLVSLDPMWFVNNSWQRVIYMTLIVPVAALLGLLSGGSDDD